MNKALWFAFGFIVSAMVLGGVAYAASHWLHVDASFIALWFAIAYCVLAGRDLAGRMH